MRCSHAEQELVCFDESMLCNLCTCFGQLQHPPDEVMLVLVSYLHEGTSLRSRRLGGLGGWGGVRNVKTAVFTRFTVAVPVKSVNEETYGWSCTRARVNSGCRCLGSWAASYTSCPPINSRNWWADAVLCPCTGTSITTAMPTLTLQLCLTLTL